MNREDYQRMISSLPNCPGIIGRDLYTPSAVFVPFVFTEGEYYLLFEKRAPYIRQGGEICFPGGHIDGHDDSSSRCTALRETVEELGLDEENIRIDGKADSVVAAIGSVIEVYVGELLIHSVDECCINPAEVEEIFLVPVRYFREHPPKEYELHLEVKPSYFDEEGREVILFPVEELGLPERYSKPWKGRNYGVLVYSWGEHTIWGITARIVDALVSHYNW
jgi:peroxisomal coenzyme A diphosphatase NUDT7